MKIENTNNVNMLYKSVSENSQKYMKSREIERQQEAIETKNTVSSFLESKGSYFDTKA